jgi:uncharacterized 2Fe-2S/4Fe-4S cluster protein (DUF4445 family)
MKTGNRCTICTGCGRCFGEVKEDTKILSFEHPVGEKKTVSFSVILVDIGTTTIAMVLIAGNGEVLDSYAVLNPQGKYGADVISRIAASEDPEKLASMRSLVLDEISKGIKKFSNAADPASCKICISANTTMTYLLRGLSPEELGKAPFKATHISEDTVSIPACGKEYEASILPGFSAFVGSDIYAGVLSAKLCTSDKYKLLCDLGTNGEIALGNKDHLYVTATAAGPAFEGGPCKGIWGADMISLSARLLNDGYMDYTGLLKDPYFDEGIDIGSVHITQDSIRALQLAKGAIYAGINIICERASISFEDIDEVILAGGFGYFLNPADASSIGLIPDKLLSKCIPGGNTSLKGALCFAEGERVLKEPAVINLAEEPSFNDLYMNALNFPEFL